MTVCPLCVYVCLYHGHGRKKRDEFINGIFILVINTNTGNSLFEESRLQNSIRFGKLSDN